MSFTSFWNRAKTSVLPLTLVGGTLAIPLPSSAQSPGSLLLGQWSDGLWYPAVVQSRDGNRIRLQFEDGDVATVGPNQVRPLNWGPGTRVQCNWQNRGTYYPGTIASRQGRQVFINYDDGDRENGVIGQCRSN